MARGRMKRSTAINLAIDEYRAMWETRYGEKNFIAIRQRKKIGEIIDAIGLGEFLERMQEFFKDNDKWITDRDHPFGYFLNNANKYRRKHGKVKSRKMFDAEAENKKEATRKSRAVDRSN